MAHSIVIKYEPVVPVDRDKMCAQICALFYPNNAAADLKVFEGTYYDTNVSGWGEATSLQSFMSQMVAYPQLNVYLRKAIRDGEYQFETNDEKLYLFLEECAPALSDQGFTFTFA